MTTVAERGGPLPAIRKHCVWCCGDNDQEVRLCPDSTCPLWPFRHKCNPDKAIARGLAADPEKAEIKPQREVSGRMSKGKKITPRRAVRLFCANCGETPSDGLRCDMQECNLWHLRIPNEKKTEGAKARYAALSPEKKQMFAERLAKGRKKKASLL